MSRYYLVAPRHIDEEYLDKLHRYGRITELGNVELINIKDNGRNVEESLRYNPIPIICEYSLVYSEINDVGSISECYTDVITRKRYFYNDDEFLEPAYPQAHVFLKRVKEIPVGEVAQMLRTLGAEDIKRYYLARDNFDLVTARAERKYQERINECQNTTSEEELRKQILQAARDEEYVKNFIYRRHG